MIMTDTGAFWDKIAKRYARKPVPDEDVYRQKLKITQGYFTPNMNVFEFGCGTGTTAIKHAPFVDHVHAIDVSAKMLEIAEEKAKEAGVDNVTFERAAIDDFSAPDESVDVVLGLSILHIVENREAIVAKVRNMLKPGGVFVSSTACLGDKRMRPGFRTVRQTHPLQTLHDHLPPPRRRNPFQAERHIRRHSKMGKQREILKHHADCARLRRQRTAAPRYLGAPHDNPPFLNRLQPRRQTQHRRFA